MTKAEKLAQQELLLSRFKKLSAHAQQEVLGLMEFLAFQEKDTAEAQRKQFVLVK